MNKWVSLIALSAACFAFTARATITISPWTPIFQGIDLATGDADASEPTPQHVLTMRVDLSNTNISFFSTPSNGTNGLTTFGQTTGTFMATYGVQAAINANFFSPCCDTTPNEPKDLLGLAISQGNIVSPQTNSGTGSAVLTLTRSNLASIVVTSQPIDTSNIFTAVSGSGLLVLNGSNVGAVDTLNPRTGIGISQDGRYLYLMVIDGREADHSAGATLNDTGAWLIRFGVYNGLNLDGGGSTAMLESVSNVPTVLNNPSDGVERVVGNNLGVFALPLTPAITSQPQSQTIFPGQGATLSVGANGEVPLAYQWLLNGAPIPGATNANYIFTNADDTDSGSYQVTVTNAAGATNSSVAIVTVTNEFIIESGDALYSGVWTVNSAAPDKYSQYYEYAGTVSGPATASVTFTPQIPGPGKFNAYVWYSASSNRTASAPVVVAYDGASLATNIDQTSGGGAWQLLCSAIGLKPGGPGFIRISNDTGETNRVVIADAARFLYLTPPFFTSQPPNQVVAIGTNVTFSINAAGYAPLSYQWQFNGTNLANATGSSLTLTNVDLGAGGTYSITVTNTVGSAVASVTLTVNLPASPRLTSVTQLPNQSLYFSFTGTPGVSYLVEASTNLIDWVTVTNIGGTNGQFDFIDAGTTNYPQRFYRVRWVP